jgi:hypothetical protein
MPSNYREIIAQKDPAGSHTLGEGEATPPRSLLFPERSFLRLSYYPMASSISGVGQRLTTGLPQNSELSLMVEAF